MVQVELWCNGSTEESGTLAFNSPGSAVGSGKILMDGSDATYADLPGGGARVDSSIEASSSKGKTVGSVDLRVWALCKLDSSTGVPVLPKLYLFGSGDVAVSDGTYTDEGGGWFKFPLDPAEGSDTRLAERLNGFTLFFIMGTTGPLIKLYEAKIVASWRGSAAPLRLYPRRDNLTGPGIRNRRPSPARVYPCQR